MKNRKLIKELQSAGANRNEAVELSSFASVIASGTPHSNLDREQKRQIAKDVGFAQERFALRSIVITAYALIAAIIIIPIVVAQYSLPGDTLYFVKRGTEAVRSKVQPDFASKAAQRREQELNELKATGASSDAIDQAEKELEKTDSGRRSSGSTIESNDHLEDSLQQNESTSDSHESGDSNDKHSNASSNGSSESSGSQQQSTPQVALIGQSQAISIAKAKMAQVAPDKTYEAPTELKQDNGAQVYYVKFSKGGQVKVRATDGYILEVTK